MVEYSKDGIGYSSVAILNGKGSGSFYKFVYTASARKVYYRLRDQKI